MSSFQQNLANIQRAASQLVTLQQNIKLSGKLTDTERRLYAENLEKLGISAQNLAHIHQAGGASGQDDFRLLFDGPIGQRIDDESAGVESIMDDDDDDDGGNVNNVGTEGDKNEEEENVGEEDGMATTTTKPSDPNDSVQVSVPDKEASVAEAKPVGLAIAGEGGVASSKPVATAVVGPGGLAIARPIATAIAGISPSEASALGIPLSASKYKGYFRGGALPNLPVIPIQNSKKYGLANMESLGGNHGAGGGILVGPGYVHESRFSSEKEITAATDSTTQSEDGPTTKSTIMATENGNDKNQDNDKIESTELPLEKDLSSQGNDLIPPHPFEVDDPSSLDQTLIPQHHHQHHPHSYSHSPFHHIPSIISPFRFNWQNTEPLEDRSSYDSLPYYVGLRNNNYNNAPLQFYNPFAVHTMPIQPYQYQNVQY